MFQLPAFMHPALAHELAAATLVLAWAAFSAALYLRHARAATPNTPPLPLPGAHAASGEHAICILFASQSGQAEAIAQQSAAALRAGGHAVRMARLDAGWRTQIAHARSVLFIASTYGEGDAPEHAQDFARRDLATPAAELAGLRYALLALGDRHYAHFCGFGRRLDIWLQASGAQAAFPRIEVDQLDARQLTQWMESLATLGAAPATLSLQQAGAFAPWQLVARAQLNAGSQSPALCKLRFAPAQGALPDWQAGDLVDLIVPDTPHTAPRTYSIASLPQDGALEIIVRTRLGADGRAGLASGWLNEQAVTPARCQLRVRANPGFRVDAGTDTPLILIGAGAGLAGLRAHLKARAKALHDAGITPGVRCAWLLFGERTAAHDQVCHDEFAAWQASAVLTHLDLCFSRDAGARRYVQHALREAAPRLRDWVARGASILVCGAAQTLAPAVDAALCEILGAEAVAQLSDNGRLRRDVF